MQRPRASEIEEIPFFSDEIISEPYEVLARLRAERPVARFMQPNGRHAYVISSYELVNQVFHDSKSFSNQFNEIFIGGGKPNPEAEAIYAGSWKEIDTLQTSDEPDHTRLRSLAQKAFLPVRIKRMSDLISGTVTTLIDRFAERGECDFMREFAAPLPINSISAILGIDPSYNAKIHEWTFSMMRRNGQTGTAAEQVFDAHKVVEMKEFIATLVAERRASPRDDLVSDLVTTRVDGLSPLSDLEILSTVNLLLVGGSDTTRSTLTSAMARLLTHPEQLARVQEDLSLAPKVMEEVLRIDTPGRAMWRVASCDTELAGVRIPKGAWVMLRMDSANRDESVFPDGDRFDIFRPNLSRHLSFGAGIHHCIGFRLARDSRACA
jgi:cytochrome P450